MAIDTAIADRISDRIVDMLNEEVKKPGFGSPLDLLAGLLLALLAFMKSAPPRPASLPEYDLCRRSAEFLLSSLMAMRKGNGHV